METPHRFDSLIALHDLTNDADRVMPTAGCLARRGCLDVRLLTVGSHGLEDEARSDLAMHARLLHGRSVTPIVIDGDQPAAAALAEYACEHPRALLCLAAHGRTAAGELACGSMTDELLARHVPMLVVGPHVTTDSITRDLLVCVDDWAVNGRLLDYASAWQLTFDADITLLEVVHPSAGNKSDATTDVQRAAQRLFADSLVVSASHDPVAAILDAAAESRGAVALATHHIRGIKRMILGSVAHEVIRWSTTPVLVIPS